MLIQINDVYKIYGEGLESEVRALDGVTLSIDWGEFVAIVGQSGSGKSTMMNVLGCLDIPTRGDYFLDGTNVRELTDKELSHIRNRQIGFIFQQYNLIQNLKVLENVELPLIYQGMNADDRHDMAMEALGRVGLANRVKHKPTEMSGGQQQRVAIARAIASVNSGTIVTVTGLVDGWYSVTCQYGTEGYIRSDFLDLTKDATSSTASGSAIVNTANQYLGTRYSYGGASPSGFDCSGFTMYVYSQHGYSLPHSATSQWQSGLGSRVYSIGELQPGDLVFFNDPSRNAGKACSHAGIYIGSGQFIHSSSSKSNGVIISDLTSGYYNTYFVGGIHV